MFCLELNELTANQLSTRLKIRKNIAVTLFDRLQREGYVKYGPSAKGRSNRCATIQYINKLANIIY